MSKAKVAAAKEKTFTQVKAVSLEDAVKNCKIDTNSWEVDTFNVKELSSGDWLYTIHFKKKKFVIDWVQFKKELISLAPQVPKINYKKENGLLWEYSCPDAHLAKLCWEEETGTNYNLKEGVRLYRKCVDDAISKIKNYKIEKIIFPIGNDYLHTDTLTNTTTAGTPQDSDTRHLKMFREGYKLLIETIKKLEQIAAVHVMVVVGNHSNLAELHIGELLSIYFENNPNVTVDNSATPRKYYKYGKTLLGFVHGNLEKHIRLPIIMAKENPRDWATTTEHLWRLGHRHTMNLLQEECGVQIEMLPSISGIDGWHVKNGYIGNTRASLSFLYDKELGLQYKFYHKV